jgi:hypothetical protein
MACPTRPVTGPSARTAAKRMKGRNPPRASLAYPSPSWRDPGRQSRLACRRRERWMSIGQAWQVSVYGDSSLPRTVMRIGRYVSELPCNRSTFVLSRSRRRTEMAHRTNLALRDPGFADHAPVENQQMRYEGPGIPGYQRHKILLNSIGVHLAGQT